MSCTSEQLRLYRFLFRGRHGIFARYWYSTRTGKSGYAPAKFHDDSYAPLTDEVILSHLHGDSLIGIYPLQRNDTTHFLVIDFDGDQWLSEAKLLLSVALRHSVPCALERSKSGKGGHVWFFFGEAILAWKARQ